MKVTVLSEVSVTGFASYDQEEGFPLQLAFYVKLAGGTFREDVSHMGSLFSHGHFCPCSHARSGNMSS